VNAQKTAPFSSESSIWGEQVIKRGGKNLKYSKPIGFLYLILLKYRIVNQLNQALGVEIKRLSG
jgi:hypothetical protein